MDKFEQLVSEAQFAVAILCNLGTSDFELIDLDSKQIPNILSARGLRFGGAMGLVNGLPRVALAEPFDEKMCRALIDAFLRLQRAEVLISDCLPKRVEYLTRVYSIPKMIC
ncbi:MAG TPA: hypothetical protein VGK36_20365 [Candidatus Angelobacter sp.]|jgi:hypothetical protein